MNKIELKQGDSIQLLKKLNNESIDVVCTDPPYLYLKHKLDRPFDEDALFAELKRVLRKNGFIVIFGRGASFYRWGYKLDQLGFSFKEEVVWDKCYGSSPLNALYRVHETVSIWNMGGGKVNKVKVPYVEMREWDLDRVIDDVKRLKSGLKNAKSLQKIVEFLENKVVKREETLKEVNRTSISSKIAIANRCESVMGAMELGANEKSIIKQVRAHYTSIHPTEKPVRLLERLLALVCQEGATVLDPFAGSASCAEACNNMGLNFIGYEIDQEYYDLAMKRIQSLQTKLF